MEQGIYYYEADHVRTYMERSPFDQASDYMYALRNNRIINASQLFISTVCAFPHTSMQHTNENANAKNFVPVTDGTGTHKLVEEYRLINGDANYTGTKYTQSGEEGCNHGLHGKRIVMRVGGLLGWGADTSQVWYR